MTQKFAAPSTNDPMSAATPKQPLKITTRAQTPYGIMRARDLTQSIRQGHPKQSTTRNDSKKSDRDGHPQIREHTYKPIIYFKSYFALRAPTTRFLTGRS